MLGFGLSGQHFNIQLGRLRAKISEKVVWDIKNHSRKALEDNCKICKAAPTVRSCKEDECTCAVGNGFCLIACQGDSLFTGMGNQISTCNSHTALGYEKACLFHNQPPKRMSQEDDWPVLLLDRHWFSGAARAPKLFGPSYEPLHLRGGDSTQRRAVPPHL